MVKKTIPSGLDPFGGIYTSNINPADMATMAPTSIPIEPLTSLDKLEQVKAAVLRTTHPVFCGQCKYERDRDCSLTGKMIRTAHREYISYSSCNEMNDKNDCSKFRRTRKSKFTRAVKWAARWPR